MADVSIFSTTYSEARRRFIDAARASGAQLVHYPHPGARGPDGEPLFLDVATLGRPDAPNVMVIGSGTHGIEGYAGSAAQSAWMTAGGAKRIPPGTALVLLHAHNPWGFAYAQRVTEENVDLNRNFVDHAEPYPANPGYAKLHPRISPEDWDEASIRGVFAALDAYREHCGEQAFSDALNGGQYSHPDGLFFGGHRAQWANAAFRRAVRTHAGHARRAAIIDLHTGIGPYLDHVFLCFHEPASPAYQRARAWWGERAVNRQGSTHKALAHYSGLLIDAFQAELPQAETTAIVVEFGTRTRVQMQRAGISLLWLRRHAERDPELARAVRAEYVEAFYPRDPQWREAVLAQSQIFFDQAVTVIGA